MTTQRPLELLSSLPASGYGSRSSLDGWTDVVAQARHRLILSSYSFGHFATADEPDHPLFAALADAMHRHPTLQVDLILSLKPLVARDGLNDAATLERRMAATVSQLWTAGVRHPALYCLAAEWHTDQSGYPQGLNHAKFAVADDRVVLVTSANITRKAFEDNLEIGVVAYDLGLGRRLTALVDSWLADGTLRRVGGF